MFVSRESRNLLPDLFRPQITRLGAAARRPPIAWSAEAAAGFGGRLRVRSCFRSKVRLRGAENYIGSSISSSALPIVETEKMTAMLIPIMAIDQNG